MNFFAGTSCSGAVCQQKVRKTQPGSNLRGLILVVAVLTLLAGAVPAAHAQANVTGSWQTLSNLMPINPIHTALMSNGKILIVSGSGNYPAQTTFYVGIWDPSTNSFTNQQTQSWDQFCNGIVVLPDGRPFIVGGNLQYDPFHGWNRTTVYDPATGKYSDMEDMAHGRWYWMKTETPIPKWRFTRLAQAGRRPAPLPGHRLFIRACICCRTAKFFIRDRLPSRAPSILPATPGRGLLRRPTTAGRARMGLPYCFR
jgi:hypothetical protein